MPKYYLFHEKIQQPSIMVHNWKCIVNLQAILLQERSMNFIERGSYDDQKMLVIKYLEVKFFDYYSRSFNGN